MLHHRCVGKLETKLFRNYCYMHSEKVPTSFSNPTSTPSPTTQTPTPTLTTTPTQSPISPPKIPEFPTWIFLPLILGASFSHIALKKKQN
jgi:hypothetical protein